jgi:hypothetical protein
VNAVQQPDEAAIMASLDINVEQVDYIIAMARDLEDALPRDDDDDESHRGEADNPELVKEHAYDAGYQELMGFLQTLSEDELAALVALVWVGRGTYDSDDLSTALEEARTIGAGRIPGYILSIPLLAEYLDEGSNMLRLTSQDEPL